MKFLMRWKLPLMLMLMYGYLVHVLVAFELFIFLAAFWYTTFDILILVLCKMNGRPKITVGEGYYIVFKFYFIDPYKALYKVLVS